jgi:hypothetical protein
MEFVPVIETLDGLDLNGFDLVMRPRDSNLIQDTVSLLQDGLLASMKVSATLSQGFVRSRR